MPGIDRHQSDMAPMVFGKQSADQHKKCIIPKVGKSSGVLDENGVRIENCMQYCIINILWVKQIEVFYSISFVYFI